MNTDTIKDIVFKALSAHIAPAKLKAMLVYEESDAYGDPILRIRAVIDVAGPDLKAESVFTATGVVRTALEANGETRFPLITYPSSDELPEVAA